MNNFKLGFYHTLGDRTELIKQIYTQKKLGFKGYMQKEMLKNGEMGYYNNRNVHDKKAAMVITDAKDRDSYLALARDEYEIDTKPLLEVLHGLQDFDGIHGRKDVITCMKYGDIYVTEKDNDISDLDEESPQNILEKIFQDIANSQTKSGSRREMKVYLPANYTSFQLDELRKILDVRDETRWFHTDDIEVCHYLDDRLEDKVSYEGKDAEKFLEDLLRPLREKTDAEQAQTNKHNSSFVERQPTPTVFETQGDEHKGETSGR